MKYIYITSSELAKLTGHNKYESIDKTVNRLLNKLGLKSIYIPQTNIEEGLNNLTKSQLIILKEELSNLITDKVDQFNDCNQNIFLIKKEIQKNIIKYIIQPTQNAGLSEEDSKNLLYSKTMNNGILQIINDYICKDLRIRRGNTKEKQNIDQLQTSKNVQIKQRNSKLYTKELIRNDNYCIILKGKVDGILDDIIIESKNRSKKLFLELRDYERVQLEAYMFLTGLNKSILTEHYNNTSNQISYNHDDQFWSICIDSIISFIDTYIVPHIK